MISRVFTVSANSVRIEDDDSGTATLHVSGDSIMMSREEAAELYHVLVAYLHTQCGGRRAAVIFAKDKG